MNLVELSLNNGGSLKKIEPPEEVKSMGLFNPSIFVDDIEDKIYLSFRSSTYTLYYSQNKQYTLNGEYLEYIKPENDEFIRTKNYICELSRDYNVKSCALVDTSSLDTEPQWKYSGLEDPRLVKWDEKFYLIGVRRDDNPTGQGRIELSEIQISNEETFTVTEISRTKIPAPNEDSSYCEKNWMPILNQPHHYIKWTSPTELVSFQPGLDFTEQKILKHQNEKLPQHFRGGSQVLKWNNRVTKVYLSIVHEVTHEDIDGKFTMSYKQRFVEWDKDWNITRISKPFSMLGGGIEFVSGMAIYGNDVLISFGFQDCLGFILKVSKDFINDFLEGGDQYEV